MINSVTKIGIFAPLLVYQMRKGPVRLAGS
jgi:hypothetical protein